MDTPNLMATFPPPHPLLLPLPPRPRVSLAFRSSFVALALAFTRITLSSLAAPGTLPAPSPALRIGVYATAGDVVRHLGRPEDRERVAARLTPLRVSRLFLEGRRGDEYVPPALLAEIRDDFQSRGIECSGGIATVPGNAFGTRQTGPLGWLDWESPRTRQDVAGYFRDNAPIFETLIVDDFFCTADESPASIAARGSRDWGAYRRDLLVSLIPPLILEPTRAARPDARLILKFPQWYDRFHLFGYDPARMAAPFDRIWVGTEVRNPATRRMGHVQPTEGYVNFRWLREVAGPKVVGAWFDHIECTARNFVDQAYLSVLAGARELTLFRLGDVMEGHPGDAALASSLPELQDLAARVRDRTRRGIPFYKPPGSDPRDNLYLMDYLAMIGWPILPVATFPENATTLVLGAQAASDPEILDRLRAALDREATVTVTPAFLRALGTETETLAGVRVGPEPQPAGATEFLDRRRVLASSLIDPIDIDRALKAGAARPRLAAVAEDEPIPFVTSQRAGRGRIEVLNLRTFSEADFRAVGEWLLPPRPLGIASVPVRLANALRAPVLEPLGVRFEAPAGVALHLFEDAVCLYNFLPETLEIRLDGKDLRLEGHQCLWRDRPRSRPRSR